MIIVISFFLMFLLVDHQRRSIGDRLVKRPIIMDIMQNKVPGLCTVVKKSNDQASHYYE